MRLAWWMTVLWLAGGCSAEVEDAPLASQRQAFTSQPITVGLDGGRLGFSLAPCGAGFLAGSPGVGSAFNTRTDAGFLTDANDSLGRAVACSGQGSSAQMFSAGQSGVRQFWSGMTTPLTSTAAVALALPMPHTPSLPLLVGQAGGTVRFFNTVPPSEVGAPLTGSSSSFGGALAWYPGTNRFAVGSPDAGKVEVFDYVGGSVVPQWTVGNTRAQFGRALAAGDVSPRLGTELIVGSDGVVFIYDQNGQLIQTLTGRASFGASLAVQPAWAPGLDALWVGEPAGDRIYQFIGDAGTYDDYLAGNRFGESLAIDPTGLLGIGAPAYPNGQQRGAVFSEQVTFGYVPVGEVAECEADAVCPAANCMRGTCQGGVFCGGLTFVCSGNQHCDVSTGVDRCLLPDGGVPFDAGMPDPSSDAGRPDAGMFDGRSFDGRSFDAGSFDAGSIDAGSIDAGSIDAGAFDAGSFDAGSFDAGSFDAGMFDAGSLDAGSFDAGLSDAGEFDGGLPDGGSEPTTALLFRTSGCSSGPSLPFAVLALLLIQARRKR